MTNIIIASFPSEAQAMAGSVRLSQLEKVGDIVIYEKAIVRKDLDGNTVVLQTESNDGARTASGMAIGTLAGAFAGPVGMLVGMVAGTLTGAAAEEDHWDLEEDIVDKTRVWLIPGTVAILAEIDEDNPIFVNSLEMDGATILRSDIAYAYDVLDDEQVAEIDAQITLSKAEFKESVDENKDKIRQKIDSLKEKRKERIAKLKDKGNNWKVQRIKKKIESYKQKIGELEGKLARM